MYRVKQPERSSCETLCKIKKGSYIDQHLSQDEVIKQYFTKHRFLPLRRNRSPFAKDLFGGFDVTLTTRHPFHDFKSLQR